MHKLFQLAFKVPARSLLAAVGVLVVACTGYINSPTSNTPHPSCPSMIADQPTNMCPRLKNMTLSCGGDGLLQTSFGGGSGQPVLVGAKLNDESVFSAVVVVVN